MTVQQADLASSSLLASSLWQAGRWHGHTWFSMFGSVSQACCARVSAENKALLRGFLASASELLAPFGEARSQRHA
eukprot:6205136-Pleurochrysis_carterae.AAC.6